MKRLFLHIRMAIIDWCYRRAHFTRSARDEIRQIEWRLSLCHSLSPDVAAAYLVAKRLNKRLND